MKKTIALILTFVMLVCFAACAAKPLPAENDTTKPVAESKKITITVDVVKSDKSTKTYTIETDAENLEDALVAEGLVEGEDSEYGLFIQTVDGETANYDENKSFWNLLKDGEAMATGARDEKIADGNKYSLVYTIAE